MTNKLVVIINSLKVPKIKKILLYEMKFIVPNYSCLQNLWLGGYRPQIPVLSVLCPQLNLLNPSPPEKNPWVRHWFLIKSDLGVFNFGAETQNVFYVHEAPRRLLACWKTYTDRQTDENQGHRNATLLQYALVVSVSPPALGCQPTRWMNWSNKQAWDAELPVTVAKYSRHVSW